MTIKIELFSVPGCSKCAGAKDYAAELGLMSSGGIAIDGRLVFPRLPSAEKLRAELLRRLKG